MGTVFFGPRTKQCEPFSLIAIPDLVVRFGGGALLVISCKGKSEFDDQDGFAWHLDSHGALGGYSERTSSFEKIRASVPRFSMKAVISLRTT